MNDSKHLSATDADPNSISIEAAREIIFKHVQPLSQYESVPVLNAVGRILAVDMNSSVDVPPFRASAMDGYAYRHAEGSQALLISEHSLAGHPSSDDAKPNECHRITTGARVPDFADTVVQQENVVVDNGIVTVTQHPNKGHHVRPVGSDSEKGSLLMSRGQRIGAAQIATLCSHGFTDVQVVRVLNVAIFSTGDELIDAGGTLPTGCIYDANRALLGAILKSPAVNVIDMGIVKDTIDALEHVFNQCQDADLILSSGGVSVGDADYVRPVLEKLGKLHVWKIAVKPGRPLTFGMLNKRLPYFGLPGNPVSAAVTCMLFVQPAIREQLSQASADLPRIQATLTSTLSKLPGRVEFQRGIVEQNEFGEWCVSTTGLQDSHVVTSLHRANCFIELGFDSRGAQAGETVSVIPFEHFSEPTL